MLTKTQEAPLRREGTAMVPDGEGWFIVNIAGAHALHTDRFGDGALFEPGCATSRSSGSTSACSNRASPLPCITARATGGVPRAQRRVRRRGRGRRKDDAEGGLHATRRLERRTFSSVRGTGHARS